MANPAPAPAQPAASGAARRGPCPILSFFLVGSAARIALRLVHGAGLVDVAFPDLPVFLLYSGMLWFQISPPGSAARRWARFALWVVLTWLTFGFAWGMVGPPSFETLIWSIAAASVLSQLYILVFY